MSAAALGMSPVGGRELCQPRTRGLRESWSAERTSVFAHRAEVAAVQAQEFHWRQSMRLAVEAQSRMICAFEVSSGWGLLRADGAG